MAVTKREVTKDERDIIKHALNLLISSQRRAINMATSPRLREASELSLADTKNLLDSVSNLELF